MTLLVNSIGNQSPGNVRSKYDMNGNGSSYSGELNMVAPLASAMSALNDPTGRLVSFWNYMDAAYVNYFEDSINMLNMILISGNAWSPEK